MQIFVQDGWMLFCLAFGIVLLTVFIMARQSRHFYTMDVVLRRFSIMDLQLPDSPLEIKNLLSGIFKLPQQKQEKSLSALRGQLYIDFLFMPAAYGAIFLLCMKISWKMTHLGPYIFMVLAWLQVVAYLFDVIENIYILNKLKPDVEAPSKRLYRTMHSIVMIKWGIALVSVICGLAAVLYFWLVGRYETSSLKYLLILVGEIVVFLVAVGFIKKINPSD